MYSLTAVENVSLDGVMQAPGRPDEDTRNGFTLGGWAAERLAGDPEAAQAAMSGRFPPAAMLFGMRTYQDLLGHWLSTSEPNPFAQVLADTPKYVTSRSDQKGLSYPNSTLLAGEAADTVRELKQRGDDGELLVLGSGALVRDLVDADLVDRFVLTTIPWCWEPAFGSSTASRLTWKSNPARPRPPASSWPAIGSCAIDFGSRVALESPRCRAARRPAT